VDQEVNKKIFQVYEKLHEHRHPSWLDIVPAYSTVSIVYDILAIRKQHASAFMWMKSEVEKILSNLSEQEKNSSRKLKIPVCYDPEFALDADRIIKEKSVSLEELITIHSSKTYHVFMIGFLPGFAYMGSVDSKIVTPRLSSPRTRVPAGSVGIAGEQTGIYPLDSPGGWNIIGKTPVKLFDVIKGDPVLLRPGDQITFIPITKEQFFKFDSSAFKITEA
ncbi:MAG TPA: 5-oxoprolinase subunit PxpB, partial [Cyclobacteriaceae bacterium]